MSEITYKGDSTDLTKSPLLNRPIIERDYNAIDVPSVQTAAPNTLNRPATSSPTPTPAPSSQPVTSQSPPFQNVASDASKSTASDFGSYTPSAPSAPTTEIPPFTQINDDDIDNDGGDTGGGGDAPLSQTGFKLPEVSAKQFANIAVEAYSIYGTKLYFNWCRIDMNNVAFHVKERNLRPDFVPLIEKMNTDALAAIKPTDEEKVLLKRALKDYFGSINAKFANPTNSLLLSVAMLVGRQVMTARQTAKENKDMLAQMLKASNGNNGYTQSYTPDQKTTMTGNKN